MYMYIIHVYNIVCTCTCVYTTTFFTFLVITIISQQPFLISKRGCWVITPHFLLTIPYLH